MPSSIVVYKGKKAIPMKIFPLNTRIGCKSLRILLRFLSSTTYAEILYKSICIPQLDYE